MTKKVFIICGAIILLSVFALFAWNKVGGETIKKPVSENTVTSSASVASSGAVVSENPVRIPIFIFHSVRPHDPTLRKGAELYDVRPDVLEQELVYLKDNGYTTISLDELVRYVNVGELPAGLKPVVLTFDDGWLNQYTYALPLLKKYQAKATFFIYPNPIERDPRFMNWKDVEEISKTPGMVIGDHTMTHPLLSKLTPEQLHHEVIDSRTILENKLGIKITHFASPFGYTSPELVTLLKENGYTTGRTTTKGTTHTSRDLFALTGYMPRDTLTDFVYYLTH